MAKIEKQKNSQELVDKLLKRNQLASLTSRLVHYDKPAFICVAGVSKNVGTSTMVCALARSIQEMSPHKKVLIIDAVVHNPSQHKLWNLPQSPGLTDALVMENSVAQYIHTTTFSNIDVLSFGAMPENHTRVPLVQNFAKILLGLKYDIVLIDSPTIAVTQDSLHLSKYASETLLVIRSEDSKAKVLKWAVQQYQDSNISISGLIFNQRRNVVPDWLYGIL